MSCLAGVCSEYGIWSRIACDLLHDLYKTRHKNSVFTGYRAGEYEAMTRGWFAGIRKNNIQPDLNRVLIELDWISHWQIFVEPGSVKNYKSGRMLWEKLQGKRSKLKRQDKPKIGKSIVRTNRHKSR